MSVARFIADQRTTYRVPRMVVCALTRRSRSRSRRLVACTPRPGSCTICETPGGRVDGVDQDGG